MNDTQPAARHSWIWLDQLWQDLRYAWRGMRRSPAFLATAVPTLAVGLALATIAFTIFNGYVLRPFAIRDPGSLHQIVWHARDGGGPGFSWRDYDELSRRTDLFSAAVGEYTRVVSSKGRPVMAAVVSLNYFEALGPAMAIGRGLARIDADPAANPAVLTDQGWARLFGRDPAVVGRDVDVNGRSFTIVGVIGPAFTGLADQPRDVFVPVTALTPASASAGEARETEVFVRLERGVSIAHAESALAPFLSRAIVRQDVRAEVRPQSSPNRLSAAALILLSPVVAAFALVLVTACANVSNMMLARAIARSREIAVRLSIGASRARLVRQLLTEGLLIAAFAGVSGLVLAAWGLRAASVALVGTLPASVAPLIRVAPMPFDDRVFLFALVTTAAATMIFALVPAVQASRVSLTDALRGHGSAPRRGSRLRNTMVAGQVAVALVLVVLAVTLVRNGASVGAVDLGFETGATISVNVRGERADLVRPLADRLGEDPRVASVAVTSGNPLFNVQRMMTAAADGVSARTRYSFVSPEFFSILRIAIARGRGFRSDEARAAAPVAIVSAASAARLWPGRDPIGQVIRIERPDGQPADELAGYAQITVVGTVGDIVTGMLVTGRDTGHIFLPMTSSSAHASAILVRGRTDRDLDAAALQEIFGRVSGDPQLFEALPLEEMRALQMYPLRAASWVGSLLGAMALALSVCGLYGVLTYTLSQRTKEIGIRMALGATAAVVVRLVMGQSARVAGAGALVGGTIAFAALQLLSTVVRLATISILDLVAFAAGFAVVMTATLAAAYQPARNAARVDPAQTLRLDP